ncbi:hypothetical protein [Streptomyces sp. NBC_01304]|uniref:hypothetical protein n=1 Tax=Streptomyces sp. NBC_01304 TaxID=2903818 RepID=UPI002E1180C2|nr:hypothetical protein OG430_44495 [Streptomyces sp. NBC_01304]
MKLPDVLTPDPDTGAYLLGEHAGSRWYLKQMIFTWRIVGCPITENGWPEEYAWDYPSHHVALTAITMFDPETMNEPPGYVKRKGDVRKAPRSDDHPRYNRARCLHGHYQADRDCPWPGCPTNPHTRQEQQ